MKHQTHHDKLINQIRTTPKRTNLCGFDTWKTRNDQNDNCWCPRCVCVCVCACHISTIQWFKGCCSSTSHTVWCALLHHWLINLAYKPPSNEKSRSKSWLEFWPSAPWSSKYFAQCNRGPCSPQWKSPDFFNEKKHAALFIDGVSSQISWRGFSKHITKVDSML